MNTSYGFYGQYGQYGLFGSKKKKEAEAAAAPYVVAPVGSSWLDEFMPQEMTFYAPSPQQPAPPKPQAAPFDLNNLISSVGGAITGVSAAKQAKHEAEAAAAGGGLPLETDWTSAALIGGGVLALLLIGGVAIYAMGGDE